MPRGRPKVGAKYPERVALAVPAGTKARLARACELECKSQGDWLRGIILAHIDEVEELDTERRRKDAYDLACYEASSRG